MELPEINDVPQKRIPKVLHNNDTHQPFNNCLVCNVFLLETGTPYMIEKSFRQIKDPKMKEVIFEYAMCTPCMLKMNAALSEESRMRINAYFQSHANLVERRKHLVENNSLRFGTWVSHCVIKGTPISRSSEYQIVAQCDGKNILYTYMPFALSQEAIEEMTALLSSKSLGEMDDFIGKYFSGPPEVAEILRKRLVLI